MGKSLRRWDLARSKTSSQVESSAWTSGVIWNTNDFPNPVGRFSKTSLLSMKAFNAFSCSGNSLVTPKTRQAFSMMAFTFSAILDLYSLAQSHSSHSSLLRITFALIAENSQSAMTSWTRLWTKSFRRGRERARDKSRERPGPSENQAATICKYLNFK